MKHWSVDQTELKKSPDAYTVWKLEQAINYGLSDGKIRAKDLRHYWQKLDIDPSKKKFISLLLSL